MTYIRLDDDLPSNNKANELTDAEFRAWIYLLCASSRARSDGHIGDGLFARIVPSKRIRNGLVSKGSVEPNGNGWIIHDYLVHQRSRADIEAAEKAGRRAARKRWASESHAVGSADRSTEWMP